MTEAAAARQERFGAPRGRAVNPADRTGTPARFVERAPWCGRDLQTVRNHLVGDAADLSGWPAETVAFAMADGDRLVGALSQPAAGGPMRPLAIVIHGLSGCADSAYVLASAKTLLGAGYPVLRLNLRGAGASRRWCGGVYHAGRSDDLAAVLAVLPAPLVAAGVVAIGYSLGASILLKYLGEAGAAAAIAAAVTVSAPIDLMATSAYLRRPRNVFYHRWLLARLKAEATAPAAELDARERAAIAGAHSIYTFDEGFIAPRHGFADAADYYARAAAARHLPAIRVPTLMIHAANDPWVPIAPYATVDWAANRHLVPRLTRGGGHVGFHARDNGATAGRWHDHCILEHLAATA